jgi:hypothetical protein
MRVTDEMNGSSLRVLRWVTLGVSEHGADMAVSTDGGRDGGEVSGSVNDPTTRYRLTNAAH